MKIKKASRFFKDQNDKDKTRKRKNRDEYNI